MKPPYDAAIRAGMRKRKSPPNRESVAEIAGSTGITTQTLYNWRAQWQMEGQLVPASSKGAGALEPCRQAGGGDPGGWSEWR